MLLVALSCIYSQSTECISSSLKNEVTHLLKKQRTIFCPTAPVSNPLLGSHRIKNILTPHLFLLCDLHLSILQTIFVGHLNPEDPRRTSVMQGKDGSYSCYAFRSHVNTHEGYEVVLFKCSQTRFYLHGCGKEWFLELE